MNRHYGSEGYQRIVPDLRGCRVDKLHSEDGRTSLVIKVSSSNVVVTMQPPLTDLEKWFAALYRWRSVTRSPSSRSIHSSGSNKVFSRPFTLNIQSSSQSAPDTPTPPAARRILDIKIGSMLLLPSRRVKTILKDNGVLSILAEGVISSLT